MARILWRFRLRSWELFWRWGETLVAGSPAYYSRVFVEERGEMAAIVIFIRALLVCWRGTIADIRSCVR